MTAGEVLELVSDIQSRFMVEPEASESTGNMVYGISGLAQLLNVSKTTAQKYSSSGVLKDAEISHFGRKLIFDKKKVFELLNYKK